jgi:hypothetical protein
MKRVEIHPDTFIFMEVAEIKPSLEMVIVAEEPNKDIAMFDFRKAAEQFFEVWGDETCDLFTKQLIKVIQENTLHHKKYNEQQYQIPTALEFLLRDESGVFNEVDITQAMDGYAKLHIEKIKQFLYGEICERREYSASKMCEEIIKFIDNNEQ